MAKVALLIGVSEYEVGLNPLPAAVKDVVALERILKDSEMGDFDEVKTLTNPEPQTMQYEVETLFTSCSKDDFVLLFFSGHGIKDEANNLYFATRITKKSPKGNLIKATAVPAKFIHDVMNGSRAKRQAIILDCCFSGAFDPSLQSKDDGSVNLQDQLGAEGRVVLTSSSSTQYSFEQQGSDLSLYTRYLIEGIETGAGDRDEDGKISVRELHEYATSKVQETAPNMTPKLITLKDLGFDLVLAKAKVTDPKLRYRRQVEKYSSRGAISPIGRTILDRLQIQLRLSAQIAKEIETEVLRPYQERLDNLQRYQQAFEEAVKNEYPLSNYVQSELEDLLEILGLRREDVDSVEQEIISRSQAARKEYQQKSQRYEEEFRRAVESEYPLSPHARNGLNDFQKSLGLKADDVEKIERPILAQKYQQDLASQQLQQKQEQEKIKREQDKLEYQRNLQRYEEEFRRAIETGYPFSDYVRNGLNDFKKSLGLKPEDITRIESPILRAKEAEQNNQQIEKLRQQQKTVQDSKTDVSSKTLISDPKSLRDNLSEEKGDRHNKTRGAVFYIIVGVVASFSSLAMIALPSFLNQATKAKQSMAKTYTGSLNRVQQAFYLEKVKFASNIQESGIGIQEETTDYSFKTQAYNSGKNSYAISTAVPKQTGLKSYIGGVFLVTLNNELTPFAVLCESTEPTTSPLSPPKLAGQSPQCASGTTQIQ